MAVAAVRSIAPEQRVSAVGGEVDDGASEVGVGIFETGERSTSQRSGNSLLDQVVRSDAFRRTGTSEAAQPWREAAEQLVLTSSARPAITTENTAGNRIVTVAIGV